MFSPGEEERSPRSKKKLPENLRLKSNMHLSRQLDELIDDKSRKAQVIRIELGIRQIEQFKREYSSKKAESYRGFPIKKMLRSSYVRVVRTGENETQHTIMERFTPNPINPYGMGT